MGLTIPGRSWPGDELADFLGARAEDLFAIALGGI
jgi:hypothetical protein